jgi:2-methylcitrate dehydratase PrpD
MEQYFKPYPVCRWAHAPIEAALKLRKRHDIKSGDIKEIEIKTFHEAVRLATNKPKTTEEAQYSTSFPLAIALAKGYISPFDLDDGQLNNKEIMRLSQLTKMSEDHSANTAFPEMRIAQVKIVLQSGQVYLSDWETPKWDHESPPSEDEITEKYKSICYPILGEERSEKILECINNLHNEPISNLKKLIMSEI